MYIIYVYVHNFILYIQSRGYNYKEIIGDYLWLSLGLLLVLNKKKKTKYQLFAAGYPKQQ